MNGPSLFFLLLLLFILFVAFGWLVFTQLRARRSGLPPPTWRSYIPFSSSGSANTGSTFSSSPHHTIIAWVKEKTQKMRTGRNRTAAGHYEGAGGFPRDEDGPTAYRGAGVGGGPDSRPARNMGPDEAWDTRVGNEADPYGDSAGPPGYFGDEEIGLAPLSGQPKDPYAGAAMPEYGQDVDERGRSRSRDVPDVPSGQGGSASQYDHERGPIGRQNPFSDAHKVPSLRGISPRPKLDSSVGYGANQKGGNDSSPTEKKSVFRESL